MLTDEEQETVKYFELVSDGDLEPLLAIIERLSSDDVVLTRAHELLTNAGADGCSFTGPDGARVQITSGELDYDIGVGLAEAYAKLVERKGVG